MRIALSCGGNQGDVKRNIRVAVDKLAANGLGSIRTSSFYLTPPVGCEPGTPDFTNAAVTGTWKCSVDELFSLCKSLEVKAGRTSVHLRYADRPLDLDIVFFGSQVIKTPDLTIPHPEALNRLFVLVPLAEIAGSWVFPRQRHTVKDILTKFTDTVGYRTIITTKSPYSS